MLKRRSLTLHLKSIVVFLLVCPSVQSAENETLYLTATINDQPVKGFIKAQNSNNKIYIAAQDMDKLNLKVSSLPKQKGYFDISSQDGLSVTFDNLNQSLIITASKNWLDRESHLSNSNSSRLIRMSELSPEVRGLALNYDLFASNEDGIQETSAYSEFRTFGVGPGFFSTSFNTQESSSNEAQTGTHRLMSSWNYENVDKLLTLRIGDGFTSSQSWTNSVRFGGVSLAHNYSTGALAKMIKPVRITQHAVESLPELTDRKMGRAGMAGKQG